MENTNFEPETPNPKLFIGGLAWAATDQDLEAAFSPFGKVVSANVVRFQDTGKSKGFGFVEFETTEEAENAKKEIDGKEIAGRTVSVHFARPERSRE